MAYKSRGSYDENGRVPDPVDTRDIEKLRRLRQALHLTLTELATLTNLNPSLLSHIESGGRSITNDSADAIANVLGVSRYDWNRDWSWQPFIKAEYALYKDLIREPGPRNRRVTANKEAHATMTSKCYKYVSIEEIANIDINLSCYKRLFGNNGKQGSLKEIQDTPISEYGPFPIFEGGAVQTAIFCVSPCAVDEVVLDAHAGQEVMVVLDGKLSFLILAPPKDVCPTRFVCGEAVESGALLEESGLHHLEMRWQDELKALEKVKSRKETDNSGDAPSEPKRWLDWLGTIRDNKEELKRDKVFYRVPVERFTFEQNDVLKYRSDWPHAGYCEIADKPPASGDVHDESDEGDESKDSSRTSDNAEEKTVVFIATIDSFFARSDSNPPREAGSGGQEKEG